jgi:hypothetical protein
MFNLTWILNMANSVHLSVDLYSSSYMDFSLSPFSSLIPEVQKKMKTDEDIITIVRPILEEVKQTVLSSHDIIPIWERPHLTLSYIPEYYKRHGQKMLDLVNCILEREETFPLTDAAAELLLSQGIVKHPITAKAIARCRFGRGECQETVHLLSLKCNLIGLGTLIIGISNIPHISISEKATHTHAFVLLGIDNADMTTLSKTKESFQSIASCLKGGVLVDPLLNIICPIKDLSTQGSDFLRYIELFNIYWINEILEINEDVLNLAPQLEEESIEIYHLAKELQRNSKPKVPLSRRAITRYQVKQAIVDLLSPDILLELKEISAKVGLNLLWKKNNKVFKFWIEGSQKEIASMQEQLQKFGLTFIVEQVKTKSNEKIRYAAFLKDPQLIQLREINSQLRGLNGQAITKSEY